MLCGHYEVNREDGFSERIFAAGTDGINEGFSKINQEATGLPVQTGVQS